MTALILIIATIIMIIVESHQVNSFKRNHKKDAQKWIEEANYRFKYHRDKPKQKLNH